MSEAEHIGSIIPRVLQKHVMDLERSYNDLLKSPEWVARRRTIKERDGHACVVCGFKKRLEVHHTYYVDGWMPWEYDHRSLVTLCHRCHYALHQVGGGGQVGFAIDQILLTRYPQCHSCAKPVLDKEPSGVTGRITYCGQCAIDLEGVCDE